MKKKKPQEPTRPFSYVEKEVTFKNNFDGTILNGTLTIPDETNVFPAVILVTGSGAQNRDEEILGHKPFLVIADHLTKAEIAVLRYDDRHYKMPVKQGWKFTTRDFAGDTKAAFDFLYNHQNIDTSFIGIIGHSEGGVIAPIVASEDERVGFIISLAGPGLNGYQIATAQGNDLADGSKDAEFSKKSLEIIINESNQKVRKRKLKEIYNNIYGKYNLIAKFNLYFTIEMVTSEWNRFFIKYDPADAWVKVLCPVLAMIGEYDIQVLPDENLSAIEEALKKAGNSDVTLIKEPALNHLFQKTDSVCTKGYTSLVKQYKESEETFSPDVLKRIADWILSRYQKSNF
jgi:pimeloyl-ACP methyl ester carboxylesterase